MKILYDHQAFTMQDHGGVSRCFVELYKQLSKDNDVQISLRETDNVYLKEMQIGHPVGYDYEHFIAHRNFMGKIRLFAFRNSLKYCLPYSSCLFPYNNAAEYGKLESIKSLRKGGFDVFHPTFFDSYFLPYLKGKPFVLTIHDMIPELYPQFFNENDMQIRGKRELAPLASAIIAVSEKTKEDVVRILGVPREKVHVIYHGNEHIERCESKPPYSFSYILYVGGRGGYKDFDVFVEKVSTVLIHHPELSVVCTGKPFGEEELAHMSAFGVQDRFVHKWVASDKEMYSLYHFAVCFIYTSEYEGFGIPILEAFAADCPVILNNASCFPEIAGDAAIYFTFDNMAEQLERFIQYTEEERQGILSKQRSRLQLYSWKESARQLATIYNSII